MAVLFLLITHELGHYLVARRFGVVAEEFAIGFGEKTLFSITKGKTRWCVKPIPFGGACLFRADDMKNVSPWKRIGIFLAGPVVNFAEGLLCFLVAGAMDGKGVIEMAGKYIAAGFSTIGYFFKVLLHLTEYAAPVTGMPAGAGYYLMVVGIFGFVLFITNIIPVPSLDGGQIAFILPELFGHTVSEKTVTKVNNACFMALGLTSIALITVALIFRTM